MAKEIVILRDPATVTEGRNVVKPAAITEARNVFRVFEPAQTNYTWPWAAEQILF